MTKVLHQLIWEKAMLGCPEDDLGQVHLCSTGAPGQLPASWGPGSILKQEIKIEPSHMLKVMHAREDSS